MQLYLTFPKLPGAPLRALRGFTRVHLRAGESRTVSFPLDDRDLSHVDAAGARLVGAGRYGVSVGGGQPGTGAPERRRRARGPGRAHAPRARES